VQLSQELTWKIYSKKCYYSKEDIEDKRKAFKTIPLKSKRRAFKIIPLKSFKENL